MTKNNDRSDEINESRIENNRDAVKEHRTCRDCGAGFVITVGEAAWYESHGLVLPTRCADCRKRRKEQRRAEQNAPKSETTDPVVPDQE